MSDPQTSLEQARDEQRLSIVGEFIYFLRASKKWWLVPILLVLGGLGGLAFLASTGAAPFIYTMF